MQVASFAYASSKMWSGLIEHQATSPGAEPVFQRYRAVLGNWRIAVTGATIFFQNAARYGLIVWVPVHFLGPDYKSAEDAAINPRWISIALPVGMAFGALTNGVISDYLFKSKRYLAISLYLLLAAAMSFIMLKIPSEQVKTGLCVLFLCGFFVYGPAASIWALCPDLVGPRRSGTATGVVNFCSYLGVGLAEPFIGRVIDDLEKFQADPSSLGDSPWASAIGSVGSFLSGQQPTAVVFAIVLVLCLLGAVTVLPIRR